MDDTRMTMTAGVYNRVELPQRETGDKLHRYLTVQKFRGAGTLASLAEDHVLFTHATLFTHGNWTLDPIYDYLLEHNSKHAPFMVETQSRIFHGLEFREQQGSNRRRNSDWCYRILCLVKEDWDSFFAFMSALAGINRDEQRVHWLLAQKLPIPDVVDLERRAILTKPCPTVEVVLFGLNGNDKTVYFKPALNPPIDKPKIVVGPPEPAVVAAALRLLAGHEQPLQPLEHRDELYNR